MEGFIDYTKYMVSCFVVLAYYHVINLLLVVCTDNNLLSVYFTLKIIIIFAG